MSTDNPPSDFGVYGEPVWGGAWEGELIPGSVTFTSGSTAVGSYMSTGTAFPRSGEHPGMWIIDDLIPVNENPPFPGWDPATQVVRFVDENGVIVVAAGYHSLAICDDLELDAEDFNMCSAEIVVDARAGLTRGAISSAIEKAVRESLRIRELGEEIERLQAELRRLELERMTVPGGVASPPPASPSSWGTIPPYTRKRKMWEKKSIEKKPIVKEEGWAHDPVFGPEMGGIAASFEGLVREGLVSELDEWPARETHDDSVDAVRMSLNTMIRKAIGLDK